MRLERDVKKAVMEYLAIRGYKVFNIYNGATFIKKRNAYAFHGTKGLPDLIAIKPGLNVLFVECKSDKGRQTPEQKEFERIVTGVPGVHYFVVRDLAEIMANESI